MWEFETQRKGALEQERGEVTKSKRKKAQCGLGAFQGPLGQGGSSWCGRRLQGTTGAPRPSGTRDRFGIRLAREGPYNTELRSELEMLEPPFRCWALAVEFELPRSS